LRAVASESRGVGNYVAYQKQSKNTAFLGLFQFPPPPSLTLGNQWFLRVFSFSVGGYCPLTAVGASLFASLFMAVQLLVLACGTMLFFGAANRIGVHDGKMA
jgi:hypothetical protein